MTDDVVGLSNSPGGSLDPDTSFHAAPEEYLRSLHRGMTLVLVAMAASLVCFLFYVFGIGILAVLGNAAPESAPIVFVGIFGILMLGVGVVGWIGKYLLTVPDPRGVWGEAFERYRRVLRVFLWMGIVVGGAALIFVAVNLSGRPQERGASPFGLKWAAQMVANIASAVLSLVQMVFLMLYFEQIGLRMHDPWIAGRAKMMVWLMPVLFLLFCTIIAPIVALVLQVQLYVRVWKGLGRVIAERAAAPVV